jgi:hypothetical protein
MAEQQESLSFFRSITPTVWVSILAALLSVGGALKVAVINASAQREVALFNAKAQRSLEREQFESNLILKAISAGDIKQSRENMRFLVEAQFIRRESDKVSHLLRDTSFHFHLPAERTVAQPSNSVQSAIPPAAQLGTSNARSIALDLALNGPSFSGIIVDEATSKPINGATISITTRRSRMRDIEMKTTGPDGRFTLHYPPRSYALKLTCPGYAEQNTWHLVGGKFIEPLTLEMKRVN